MKTKSNQAVSRNELSLCLSKPIGLILTGFLLMMGLAGPVGAQMDDFDDGNDDGWTRFNPMVAVGAPATYSFPDGGYRLQAPAPSVGAAGPARVFTYHPVSYTDFFASVDIVDWNNDVNQAFGLLVRAGNIGLGTTTGYVVNYNPNQTSGQPGGQFQINRATGEAEDGTLATANIRLIPTRSYRMVAIASGPRLTGYLYDVADLTSPIATISVSAEEDERAGTYPEGFIGLFGFSRGSATEPTSIVDVTFDNYWAMEGPPATVALPGTPHGIPGTPQVVNRSPVSHAAFHPASEGITFTATTLTGEEIAEDSISLFLNGVNVSSQLTITGEPDARTARFSGLRPNTIYEAEIVLANADGPGSVNAFLFDTFDADQFESNEVKVIEAEDYNFSGGDYIDDPPPSGLNANGEWINVGEGYYSTWEALQGVDYFDFAGAPHQVDISYRPFDVVATRPGSDDVNPGPRVNDILRPKHIAAGVPDYQVWRTEAGEWLNYTRVFAPGDYNVYLRVASRADEVVHLDRVTSDRTQPDQTTSAIGRFQVPNTVSPHFFRFVPLTDETGRKVAVSLDGEETVRLTMGGEPQVFSSRFTLYLNYMVFMPAADDPEPELSLEFSANVVSGYAEDPNAVIDSQGGTITVPLPEESRFYRIRSSNGGAPSRISNIRVAGENLVLDFGFE